MTTPAEPWTAKKLARGLVKSFLDTPSIANFFEIELHAHHDDAGYSRRADLLSVFTNGLRGKDARFIRLLPQLISHSMYGRPISAMSAWEYAYSKSYAESAAVRAKAAAEEERIANDGKATR